ncbi:hypothetical protein Dsin_000478 [Dipteronia sinensis]|uniref:Uncharacterized protein n=1 Tax=Dipteronia sinensis TaxID=43782 RepID=A0AAE0B3B2_9ROSI|nr:hypothetical protein Dsin_000478 [Dipteronia sinensis]
MGEIHVGHSDHKLVLKNYKKEPYICDDHNEPGIGSRCRCEDYENDLHKHYMFYKSTTHHAFFPKSTYKFLFQPPAQH